MFFNQFQHQVTSFLIKASDILKMFFKFVRSPTHEKFIKKHLRQVNWLLKLFSALSNLLVATKTVLFSESALECFKLRAESYLRHRRRVQDRVFHMNDNLIHNILVCGNDTHTKTRAHNLAERVQSDHATVGVERKERCRRFIQEMKEVISIVLHYQEIVFLRQVVHFPSSTLRQNCARRVRPRWINVK